MDIKAKPWMADCEIEIMDSIFKAQRPRRVLEWGAGGSTLCWPPKYDFIETWLTVEHDVAYAEAVRNQADYKVTILHLTPPRYWDWAEQVEAPYDLIIVDGRHRVECLKAARDLLALRGIVILHDSGRSAYNEAWKVWPRREELYPGEKFIQYDCGYWTPNAKPGEGYYRHRGITVFWADRGVKQAGWCREYQVEPLKRPRYKKPRPRRKPKPVVVVEDDGGAVYTPATDGL